MLVGISAIKKILEFKSGHSLGCQDCFHSIISNQRIITAIKNNLFLSLAFSGLTCWSRSNLITRSLFHIGGPGTWANTHEQRHKGLALDQHGRLCVDERSAAT